MMYGVCHKCFCVTLDKSNRTFYKVLLIIKKKDSDYIRRTISICVGKGSVNHNCREFNAKNTDPERTPLNTEYCNEKIKDVYHELFDDALQRYNKNKNVPTEKSKTTTRKSVQVNRRRPFTKS